MISIADKTTLPVERWDKQKRDYFKPNSRISFDEKELILRGCNGDYKEARQKVNELYNERRPRQEKEKKSNKYDAFSREELEAEMIRISEARRNAKTKEEIDAADKLYRQVYYRLHKDKAKESQKIYNINHPRKHKQKKGNSMQRLPKTTTFSRYNIWSRSPEKTIERLNGILQGRYSLVD